MRKSVVAVLGFAASCALGSTAARATCPALPYTFVNGQASDATQLMANLNALVACQNSGPGGTANALQYNNGSSGLAGLGPLTNGQLVIGSTGNPPQAATLTAGSGITITNQAGGVTISSNSPSTTALREFGAYAPPSATTSLTQIDSIPGVVPTIVNIANVGLRYSVPMTTTNGWVGAYRSVPSAPWTLTFRAAYSGPGGNPGNPSFGVWIKDTAGKMLGAVIESGSGTPYLQIKQLDSKTAFNSNIISNVVQALPQWFLATYDGTNIQFAVSWDGQNWFYCYNRPANSFLNGSLSFVGIGGSSYLGAGSWTTGATMGAVVTYWDINGDPASGRIVP